MPYFTSWDVNTFLCFVYLGLPDDVGKKMMRIAKKSHEEFSLGEAMSYWVFNYPKLVITDIHKGEPCVYRLSPIVDN